MKVALYARVSTVNGHQDPENQLQQLRAHCQRRGWEVVREYVDRISGTKERRPRLDSLMTAAREKKLAAVLVWKFDRFARSLPHLRKALDEFRELGIKFVSLTEGFDTDTPAGKALFSMLGVFAEFELDLMKERVKLRVQLRKKSGIPFGPQRRVTVSNEELQARLKKESVRTVAESLGCSPQLLYSRLKTKRAPRGVVKA